MSISHHLKYKLPSIEGSFRIRAYRKYIDVLRTYTGVNRMGDIIAYLRLNGIKCIGEEKYYKTNGYWKSSILNEIDSYLMNTDETKPIKYTLLDIPEIGPSKVKCLNDNKIYTIEQLKDRLDLLNDKQLLGLTHYKDLSTKIPRSEMDQWANIIGNISNNTIKSIQLAGSYRRMASESGDLDVLISSNEPTDLLYVLDQLQPYIKGTFIHGEKKYGGVVRLNKICRKLDIAIYPTDIYPFALLHWTGSGKFNTLVRKQAIKKNLRISEYGLLDTDTNKYVKGDWTERSILHYLGIEYVEPQNRHDIIKLL